MNRRVLLIGGIGLAAVAVGIVAWYLASPLFIDRMVDEAFPIAVPSAAEMDGMSPAEIDDMERKILAALPEPDAMEELPDEVRARIRDDVERFAAALPARQVVEPMPGAASGDGGAAPELWASGSFRDGDRFHQGSGSAKLYRTDNQGHLLRFEDFRVTNGPALHVLLATNLLPTNRHDLGEYLDLGDLKGNVGDQNYQIPAATDLSSYASVVIYCKPFHVVFATAPLERTE